MHIARTVAAIAACWLVTAAVAGAATGSEEDPAYANAFAAAAQAGKPTLFLYTTPTNCPLAQGARNYVMHNASVRRNVHTKFVVVEIRIANGDQRYAGYRQKFSGKFVPFWVAATPEGEYLAGGDYDTIGSAGEKGWSAKVLRVAEQHPPISAKNQEKARTLLADAQAALKAERYGEAAAAAEKLKVVWFPAELVEGCAALTKDVDAAAQNLLRKAGDLERKKEYLEAALVYHRIVAGFTVKRSAGKSAASRLTRLRKKHSEIEDEFKLRKRSAEAETMIAKAKGLEEKGKLKEARVLFSKVLRSYADTPWAAEAKEGVERIAAAFAAARKRAAPAPSENPAEDQAKSLLALARSYYASGMTPQAKAKLAECIEKYADTAAAKQAAVMLKEWK